MFQGHQIEIHRLNRRPNRPVGFQPGPIVLIELLLGIGAFHDRHSGEKEGKMACRKHTLIR